MLTTFESLPATSFVNAPSSESEVTPLLSYVEEKPSSHNDWRKRIKISLDIARGLEHLHRHEIVHG